MTRSGQSSIWRWVLTLAIVVALFGPGVLSASPDADPSESGTNEAALDSDSDARETSWPNPDEPSQGWWIHPCCI